MDFFGILFDMKNGKKVPYSKTYFDTLFAAKLGGSDVKTLTGALPLTFTTSETALRSWTIYGNNTPHNYSATGTLPLTFTTHTAGNADDWSISGNDKVGKNLLEITAGNQTLRGVTFTVDKASGTIALNGDTLQQTAGFSFRVATRTDLDGTYLLSGGADGGSSNSYDLHMYDSTEQRFSGRCYDSDDVVTFNCIAGHETTIYIQCRKGYIFNNVVFKPMLRLPDTSPDFEPYQVGVGQRTKNLFPSAAAETKTVGNLSVTSDGNGGYTINKTGALNEETVVTFDIPEFTIPVSQGQGGNGVIALFNTKMLTGFQIWFYYDDTYLTYYSLSTAANRVITNYADLSGVTINKIGFRMTSTSSTATVTGTLTPMTVDDGVAPANFVPYGYEIPISVNSTPQTFYIGDTPLTDGETISKSSTGVDIAAIAGTNTISTDLYNKPEMAIEGVDYVGVGAKSGDDYIIRVQSSATIAPYNPSAPESDTSYVYNDSTHTLDTDSQFKTALISWQGGSGNFTITKTKGSTFKLESLTFMGNWGGADHYIRANVITPTGISYTGSTEGTHLLITYYDSEVDTLTPREIRESITVSASVYSTLEPPLLDAPLTEGETLTMEDVGHNFTTFAGVENTIEPFNPEIYDYGEFDMSITYKGG